jgi:hypothetical protein
MRRPGGRDIVGCFEIVEDGQGKVCGEGNGERRYFRVMIVVLGRNEASSSRGIVEACFGGGGLDALKGEGKKGPEGREATIL